MCVPIVNPRFRREFLQGPAKLRPGALTRSDMILTSAGKCRDIQASTLTQNDTGPVGPVTPSIYWS